MNILDAAGNSPLAGRYAIRREIGRGGMATVYVADDVKHERQVAVKVLHPELSAAIGAERFTREIKVAARLQHPHILPLYDSGELDGALYFIMPFVDGESLRERMSREGSLLLDELAGIMRQIADALDYAHVHGVVHRDIKPENVLLSRNQAFLADFGVAKAAAGGTTDTLTSFGVTLGTPAYMSPEQASGERDINGRSDLYALGCVAYEALAGAPPFSGPNAMAIISQHLTKPPPRLVSAREAVPEDVAAAVARLLAKDPAERFGAAAPFATVLEAGARALRPRSHADAQLRAIERDSEARKSVCVVDFSNIANVAELDWLSGGIAETLTVDLRKIGGIRVVGSDPETRRRMAVARAAGVVDADAAVELARSVGAGWVVWGAFQKVGDRIRLTPQFAEVASGETVSAEKIDGKVEDIFELQDRIVTRLAEILRIRLTSGEVERIARPETTSVTAYELYARGKQAFNLFGKESAEAAAEYFRRAIEIDPDYALAWGGLGSLLMPRYIASGDRQHLADGVRALQRAMELDPALGEPYVFLAYMYGRQHRYDDAISAARSAIEREPNSYMGWYLLGIALSMRALETGTLTDLAQAIPPLLRCRALNRRFHPAQMVAGSFYMLRGQYGHATSLVDEAVELEREGGGLVFLGSYVQRAYLHVNSDEHAAARPLLDLAVSTYPGMDHVYAQTMTAYAHFVRGALAERERDAAAAEREFSTGCEIAEAHDHRLGIGAHWVKSKLGLARVASRSGDATKAQRFLDEALQMRLDRSKYVWSWILGCSEAEILYEVAATHAALGSDEAATSALEQAASMGWADVHQLGHDVHFGALREREVMRQITTRATGRVTLPPPVGSGGFPDLE